MIWFYFLLFIISCIVLSYSGTWIIKSLVRIAQFLKWKNFVVSSILMGFSTSLPETFIGIMSAFHREPELILGVIIGSNMIALTVLIAIGAIFKKGLMLKKKSVQKSTVYAIFYSLVPFLLIKDGTMSRIDGIILLALFVFYSLQLISQEKRFSKIFNRRKIDWANFKVFLFDLLIFYVGLFLLLLSSEGVVVSTSKIATTLNISTIIVSIFLIAVGTSLPEITFGIKSIKSKQKDMIIGDSMGSIVTNSTLVLGLTSLITPITLNNFTPYVNGSILILVTCLAFLIFAESDHEISKKEAFVLIAIYLFFILIEINPLNISHFLFFNLQQ